MTALTTDIFTVSPHINLQNNCIYMPGATKKQPFAYTIGQHSATKPEYTNLICGNGSKAEGAYYLDAETLC